MLRRGGTLAPPPLRLHLLVFVLVLGSSYCDDRAALLGFKAAVSDPSGLLSPWSPTSDPCSWPWVVCDGRSAVVALNVSAGGGSSRRLSGELPAALGGLSSVRVLSLPFHAFSGRIPPEISRLDSLEDLDLESNGLSGPLPSQFPPRLRVLNLAFNQIQGVIPPSLSFCYNLETLNLSGNQLNGSIPGYLSHLPNLRALSLAFNLLGGMIPEEIGFGCSNLEQLDLSGNFLVGGIPRSLGNCNKLQSLILFSNLFDDVVPPELGRLQKLRVLDVSRNTLSGPVPQELGGCMELSVLVLSNPYYPVRLQNVSSYDFDDFNYFQGGIPENITSLPKLRVLWAPRVSLEGLIPSNWGSCQSLEMVHLGHNCLNGEIPSAFMQCKNLKFLNLSSNNLTGWIGEELPVPCMDVFDVSGNQLSGSIPKFISASCNSSQLPVDGLSSSYYSFFWSRTWAGLSLPAFELDGYPGFYHNFGRNNFTGSLPSLPLSVDRLGKPSIYAFLADGNVLVGTLTDVLFEKCKWLNGFITNLSNNLISGEIPAGIGSMCTSLMVFSVAGNRIRGAIPDSLGQLESLVTLDLSKNHLQGQIPESFRNLKAVQYLSLASNNLIGQIPNGLSQLHSLQVVDLSSNSLSGGIPSDLANLKNLTTLLLPNNKLSGQIPSCFAKVASLVDFNVSYNNLSGPLPFSASTVNCDSVLGNPFLQPCHANSLYIPPSVVQGHGDVSQTYTSSSSGSSSGPSSPGGFTSIEIASITSAAAIVSVLLALVVLCIYTRKCAPRLTIQPCERKEVTVFTDIGVPLTYETVVRATGNFNASNCIGSGGFGATYKAEISPGVLVAIKRLSVGRFQGVQQFHAEVKTLGRWRHPNLVTLIGYHVSEAEMFLIYNYLPGGNLEKFIRERSKRPVDWRTLHKIALDIARALAYLHDHCVPRILHRDVKPSNILLDNDFNAYLSDFGLARLLGNSETHATTGVAGTFGYVAPEYAMTCRVSDKADVYSYGVVLLELISDKKALDPSFSPYGNGFNIVAWACMLLRHGRAREFFTEGLWDVSPHDDLVETLHLAVKCTVESLSIRPTMKQVVQRLKQLQPPNC